MTTENAIIGLGIGAMLIVLAIVAYDPIRDLISRPEKVACSSEVRAILRSDGRPSSLEVWSTCEGAESSYSCWRTTMRGPRDAVAALCEREATR